MSGWGFAVGFRPVEPPHSSLSRFPVGIVVALPVPEEPSTGAAVDDTSAGRLPTDVSHGEVTTVATDGSRSGLVGVVAHRCLVSGFGPSQKPLVDRVEMPDEGRLLAGRKVGRTFGDVVPGAVDVHQ